jgi:hypothetical protein
MWGSGAMACVIGALLVLGLFVGAPHRQFPPPRRRRQPTEEMLLEPQLCSGGKRSKDGWHR